MWWEHNYPRVISAGALVTYALLSHYVGLPAPIFGLSLSVATLAVGFAGTIGALLLTLNSPVLEVLKRRGRFSLIVGYVWNSVRTGFLFIVYTIIMYWLVTKMPTATAWLFPASVFWVGIATYAVCVFYRAIDIATYLARATVAEVQDDARTTTTAPAPTYKTGHGR